MNEMSKTEFQELLEAMKKDKEGTNKRKFWSPPSDKEGTYVIRFLPQVKKNGEKVFYFHHRAHWLNGNPYECPKQTITDKNGNLHEAEECPICKLVKKLYDTTDKESDEYKLAGSLKAQDRYIYRIVVRGSEDEAQPVFYESGKKLFESLYHILTETDFGNIVDLKDGRDFNLVKKGTKRKSNYDTSTPSANVSMVFKSKEDLFKLITNLEAMPTFSSLIEFSSVESLKKALKEYISGEDSSDEELEETAIAAATNKAAKSEASSQPVEDEDDDDDEVSRLLKEFEL